MAVRDESVIYGNLLKIMEKLYHIKDVHALLDAVLLQARQFAHADAGSIYLI